jgi:hypothetical protein
MRTGRLGGIVISACVLVAAAGFATPSAHAQQQMRLAVTMGGPGGFGDGAVSKRSVEKYVELLNFTADQKESALAIHEGYTAACQEAMKARRAAMEDLRKASEDSDDHSVFMEKFPAIEKTFREKSDKLEKGLFDDLKGIISGPAQEARWPKVERMRRREIGLRRGGVSGENIDLTDVVAGLKLSPEAMTPVSAVLEEYETELDHQLQEQQKVRADSQAAFEPGKPFDAEQMKKQMDEARQAGLRVKDVNDRSARKIEPLLPEDKRAAFRDTIKERTYPQVYRPSRAVREIDAALKFDDLSASQKATLNDLKAEYQRSAGPLNDAWAQAIASAENQGNAGTMITPDGGRMVLKMEDDPPALTSARKARRDLDDKTRDKVKAVLNTGQQDKLAKATSNDSEDGAMIEGVHAITIRGDQ